MVLESLKLSPQRKRGKPSADGDFVVYEAVPVFDSHVGDDGVEYDTHLLRKIAENCNRRIRETGDYCPIVIGHTKDSEDKRSPADDPEVIGLAGPFWVGSIGQQKARPCIMANFWIFPDCERVFLRNPRRSVEIWPEERPEDRYFDPIAVLGAETPKRDLGMVYSRRRSPGNPSRYCVPGPLRYSKRYRGSPPQRYEATCAGGGAGQNTFIPAGTNIRKQQRNAKGEDSMSPDDLAQLADALKPMLQAMVEDAVVAVQSSEPTDVEQPELDVEGGAPGLDAAGGAPGLDAAGGLPGLDAAGGEPGLDALGGAPGLDAAGGPPGLDAAGGEPGLDAEGGEPGLEPEGEELGEGEEPEESFEDLDDEKQTYAKCLGKKYMKYQQADKSWDDDGADRFVGSLDNEDTGLLDKFMKYACHCDQSKTRYSERYGKDWSALKIDVKGAKKEGEPKKYAEDKPAPLTDKQKGMFGAGSGKYSKANMATKYRKLVTEHEQLKQRYSKAMGELESAGKELTELRAAEKYAKRYARLKDLESEGYVLEAAEEMELTEDFSDDQFDRHCDVTVRQKYGRVTSTAFPMDRERKSPVAEEKPQKYAKQARTVVDRLRKTGRDVQFADVLRHLITNDGQLNEEELLKNGKAKV